MDNNKNIDIVVNLLKEHNMRYIVISPGGTNMAFVKMVQDDPFFRCYSVVDERSAVYFAIGIYLQMGEPVVLSCTSAQATRNYIPGLTEAFYKRVPIFAITMTKHPRFTYQMYMQAPDQDSLPNDCVKKSFVLPCVTDENDLLFSNRLVNDAMLELTRNGMGPVQLCIPWLDFPIMTDVNEKKVIRRFETVEFTENEIAKKRILICIGEHRPFSKIFKEEIEQFCERMNAAIYVNHLSNYGGKYVFYGNLAFTTMTVSSFINDIEPDVLITIGGQTGDYPLYKLLSNNEVKHMEHWIVSETGEVVDTYDKLTKIYHMTEQDFFIQCNRIINKTDNSNHEYLGEIIRYTNYNYEVDMPLSNLFIAMQMSKRLPANSVIQFSILNSLRMWNLVPMDESIVAYSNVGAFGIDGGLSTLIGQSVVTDDLAFMIIGDLAFLYDINSISIKHIKSNLRIILVNNDGGVEFKLYKGNHKSTDRYIAAAGHFKNAQGWAESCGFKYVAVKEKREFVDNLNLITTENEKPILVEVFVNDIDEYEAYMALLNANSNVSAITKVKNVIKRFL